MTFTIHAGIAKPELARPATGSKYPFAAMQVGEVLHFPFAPDASDKTQVHRRAQSALGLAKKRHTDRKFSTRTVAIAGVNGVGIWRDA